MKDFSNFNSELFWEHKTFDCWLEPKHNFTGFVYILGSGAAKL